MIASDGKYSVEWDGDFKFGVAAPCSLDLKKVVPARAVGASFVSGKLNNTVVHVERDGTHSVFEVMGSVVMPVPVQVERFPSNINWTLCGPGVADAQVVSDICHQTKAYSVSVCPIVEHLAAFGQLAGTLLMEGKEKPYMTRFCAPCEDLIDAESQEYDEKLEGDCYGRMAHLVQARTPVFNQIMKTPSIKAFYGRVLSTKRWWGIPIFLMTRKTAGKYFPCEPLSIRNYAATWVPVAVKNTDEFKKTSDYQADVVKIFIASDFTPGLGSFLRFHHLMGKEDIVASSDPIDMGIPDKIPVFRWNQAYNISKELFDEVRSES